MAARAESFITAGALNPQWVINTGPFSFHLLPGICTVALGTESPIKSFRSESGTLNVNSDGTGGTISIPSSLIKSYPETLLNPPVVTMTLAHRSVSADLILIEKPASESD